MTFSTKELPRPNAKTPRASGIISDLVFNWIERKFKDGRLASKKLATFASYGSHQVSARTTEAWLSRRSPPCSNSLEIMAARCEELAKQLEEERKRLRDLLSG